MSLDLAAAVTDCSTETLSLCNQYVFSRLLRIGRELVFGSALPSPTTFAAIREISDQGASQLAVSLGQNAELTALDLEENAIEVGCRS
jgi:hypothetical protein